MKQVNIFFIFYSCLVGIKIKDSRIIKIRRTYEVKWTKKQGT